MTRRTAPLDRRDARDLRILQLAETCTPQQIAQITGVQLDVVRTVLAEDEAAFPGEPISQYRVDKQ